MSWISYAMNTVNVQELSIHLGFFHRHIFNVAEAQVKYSFRAKVKVQQT